MAQGRAGLDAHQELVPLFATRAEIAELRALSERLDSMSTRTGSQSQTVQQLQAELRRRVVELVGRDSFQERYFIGDLRKMRQVV